LTAAAIDAARHSIQRSIREAIPALGDFCLVHLVHGRTIRCVAGAHSTREGGRAVRELIKAHRIRPDDRASTVAHVVRSRRSTLRKGIHPDPDDTRAGGIAELRRRLAPTSALVVPILRDGVALGALSLCFSDSGRSYSARQISPAERLAARIADALIPSSTIDATLGPRTAARYAEQDASSRRRVAVRP
jgi:GAF domain-containing protein